MTTQLAWHNLVHTKVRTCVALIGIVFAIVLMFMQLGFLEAVKASATVIYDGLDFDLCIRSRDYLHLAEARSFPADRLTQAESLRSVTRADPLVIANNYWRNPHNGERRAILCYGVSPQQPPLRSAALRSQVRKHLNRPDVLLIDDATRREYGPQNGEQFGAADHDPRHPVFIELNQHTVRIADHYQWGTGLSAGAAALMSVRGLRRATPWLAPNEVTLGLVQIETQQQPRQVARALRTVLPEDVDVKTRAEVLDEELTYWVWQTNYGRIFQVGVGVALIVGAAIVYQVLSSDVVHRLPEFATLKAMGYGNGYIGYVIVQQAAALAIVGFALGLLLAEALYLFTSSKAGIPVRMTTFNVALVLGLSLTMCVGSGLAAARKAFRADPADLF